MNEKRLAFDNFRLAVLDIQYEEDMHVFDTISVSCGSDVTSDKDKKRLKKIFDKSIEARRGCPWGILAVFK